MFFISKYLSMKRITTTLLFLLTIGFAFSQNPKELKDATGSTFSAINAHDNVVLNDSEIVFLADKLNSFNLSLYLYHKNNSKVTLIQSNFCSGALCYTTPLVNRSINGKAYFTTSDCNNDLYLFVTDGTPEGTKQLADLKNSEFNAKKLVELDGIVYFTDGSGNQQQGGRTEVTVEGTY